MTRLKVRKFAELFTFILLVILSSFAINSSRAEESPGEAFDVETFSPIDLDLKLDNVRGWHKIESRLGNMVDERVAGRRGSDGIRVIVEFEFLDSGLLDGLESF